MNVILYVVDALRPDHLSCYGYKRKTSPNIDKFASEGFLFEDAFAQSSWTRPSAASLLTSTYPSVHGASTVNDVLSPEFTALAEHLTEGDYITAGFSAIANVSSRFGFDLGFQEFYDLWGDEIITKKRSTDYFGRTSERFKVAFPLAEDINGRASVWLEEHKNSSFFLLIWAIDTHDPYEPPEPFDQVYSSGYNGIVDGSRESRRLVKTEEDLMHIIDLYDGEISYLDEQFGAFIKKLKQMGIYDSTLFVVTSDHGEVFRMGERITIGHGQPPYEEQIRIPLIMRIPDFAGGKRIPGLVQSIDIMPTILDALRLQKSDQAQGTSLLPLIKGEAESITDAVYSENLPKWTSIRTRTGKYVRYLPPRRKHALTSSVTFMRYIFSFTRKQFFDLENDPYERSGSEMLEVRLFVRFRSVLGPIIGTTSLWRRFVKYAVYFMRGFFANTRPRKIQELERKLNAWSESNKLLRASIVKKGRKPRTNLDEDIKQRLRDLGYLD